MNTSLEPRLKLESGAFYGTTEHRRKIGGLTLAETVYPTGFVIPPHEHDNPFFCLLLEGRCTQFCDYREWTGSPFTLTVFPAGLMHANHWHDSGGRVLHVEFTDLWLQRIRERTEILDRLIGFEDGAPIWLARRLFEEYKQPEDAGSSLAVEGLTLELLAACTRSDVKLLPTQAPPWLQRIREFLHDNRLKKLSLAEIAVVEKVSADYLVRAFRRCYGITIGEYVRQLRVESACWLLAAAKLPLSQIALEAGFTDQSHFTKVFKRHTGMTPAIFRKLHGSSRFHTKE